MDTNFCMVANHMSMIDPLPFMVNYNKPLTFVGKKELMDMIDKDAILVQVTGNDKGRFVNKVYDSHFPGMDGNIYTMIRTIKTHGDDFIFDPSDTSKKNDNEFDPDLV